MSDANIWWIIAGAVVALELTTGTFYLLMLAVGMIAGALAAMSGVGVPGQLAIAGLVGLATVGGWHFKKSREPAGLKAGENPDVSQDVGARVQVDSWAPDGSARVNHRGASWGARPKQAGGQSLGLHRVVEVDGSTLVLEPIQGAAEKS